MADRSSGPPRIQRHGAPRHSSAADEAGLPASLVPEPSPKVSVAARLGSTSLISGLFGGFVGGLLGLVIFGVVDSFMSGGDIRRGALVFVISISTGTTLMAWQQLTAGQVAEGASSALRSIPFAVLGAAIGLIIATPVFGALDGYTATSVAAFPALVSAFALVAGSVGFLLGLSVNRRKAVVGLLGGLLGGAVGGAVLALIGGSAQASLAELALAIPLVTVLLGGAMGIAERIARESWIEVVDGPLGGREIVVYGNSVTLGNGRRAVTLGDQAMAAEHLRVDIGEGAVVVEPAGPGLDCHVNFEPLTGRRTLADGDVISVCDSHVRVHRRP